MKRPRRHKTLPQLPPAPRLDLKGRRIEDEFFEAVWAEQIWRRPTPL